jgi:hypothetical protein
MKKLVVLVCAVLATTGALATDSSSDTLKKKLNGKTVEAAKVTAEEAEKGYAVLFEKIDADKDGVFTQAEFEKYNNGKKVAKQFLVMDTDKNGTVDKTEYFAFKADQFAKQNESKRK